MTDKQILTLIATVGAQIARLEARMDEPVDTPKSQAPGFVPPGIGAPWFGDEADIWPGWLPCKGQSVSKTMYPGLFKAIGYKYGGSGDSFTLPTCGGKYLAGYLAADPDFGTIGWTFGAKTHSHDDHAVGDVAQSLALDGMDHRHDITHKHDINTTEEPGLVPDGSQVIEPPQQTDDFTGYTGTAVQAGSTDAWALEIIGNDEGDALEHSEESNLPPSMTVVWIIKT